MNKAPDSSITISRKHHLKSETKFLITGLLFALPGIIYLIGLNLIPIIQSAYYSLCDYSILRKPVFIGLTNYKILIHDANFYKALYNTFYMVLATPLNLIFALVLAILLNMKVKAMPLFRVIFYLPALVPAVAAAVLWRWIFNGEYGIINNVLGLFGIQSPLWLVDAAWTKPAIIVMGIWGAGSTMIIYLAALQGVPESLYEAAELDGANIFQRFKNVTMPFISPVTLFLLLTMLISRFQMFTEAYVFAENQQLVNPYGPNGSLMFYAFYIYNLAFRDLRMGYASALAWILFIIVAIITVIIFKSSLKWVYYDEGGNS